MLRKALFPKISAIALCIGLVSCAVVDPNSQPSNSPEPQAEPGTARFSFSGSEVPAGSISGPSAAESPYMPLPDDLDHLIVSVKDSTGAVVKDREILDLVLFGNGYVSESLSFDPGTYTVTEFIIVDDENEARFATPIQGSAQAANVQHPLPVAFTVATEQTSTVTLEVLEIPEDSTPVEFGYIDFAPIWVVPPFPLTLSVFGETAGGQTMPIPFALGYRGKVSANGSGSGVSYGYSPIPITTPVYALESQFRNGDTYTLQVRAYGYQESPKISYTMNDLYAKRNDTPVISITLQEEQTQVEFQYDGPGEDGYHNYTVHMPYSSSIDDYIASVGGTESDIFSFTIGFKLMYIKTVVTTHFPSGLLVMTKLTPSNIGGRLPDMVSVPYDGHLIQSPTAYRTLEGHFSVDSTTHSIIQDSEVDKYLNVYTEVLALRGDGSDPTQIDGGESFLGFKANTLMIAPSQIVYN